MVAFNVEERQAVSWMMPPHAASVYWAKGMLEIAAKHIEDFKYLELPIEDSDEVQLCFEKHGELNTIIQEFQDNTFKEWTDMIKEEAGDYLNEKIIGRGGNTIVVRYNTEVIGMI